MTTTQRHLVIYEQSDGSFRIPPNIAMYMASGDEPLQRNEGHTESQTRKRSFQRPDDSSIEFLRYENQLYKRRYVECLKQLEELNQLSIQISRKLDLALRYSQEGMNIEMGPPSEACRLVDKERPMVQGLQLQTDTTEVGSTSGCRPHRRKLKASQHIPPKKRPFP